MEQFIAPPARATARVRCITAAAAVIRFLLLLPLLLSPLQPSLLITSAMPHVRRAVRCMPALGGGVKGVFELKRVLLVVVRKQMAEELVAVVAVVERREHVHVPAESEGADQPKGW